jgi:hypothetical protein
MSLWRTLEAFTHKKQNRMTRLKLKMTAMDVVVVYTAILAPFLSAQVALLASSTLKQLAL